jgi:hypothetical protein
MLTLGFGQFEAAKLKLLELVDFPPLAATTPPKVQS